jgi:hypothetical protein
MTPLVAGIALTGKAPMYENVYMSGLKQKAAGEAAAAKQRAKAEEDIEKSINIDYSKYHYSMQKLVKEKAAKAVSEMRNAIAEDNVRGINRANDIKRELLIDLAGIANTSNQLFEREKPTYTSTYIRPEVTFRELNSKDIRDVVKDPAVQQELEDYGMQINVDSEGRVSINFSDIKSFDVRKDYNTFQADIIDQFAPQLAESFRAGSTTRQELSQVITKQRSDDYLDAISSNPIGGRSAIFNWKKKYDIDITTPEGKQKVYEMFVAPERTGVTDRPRPVINVGTGTKTETSPVVSETSLTANTSFNWSPSSRPEGHYVLQFTEGFGDKNLVAGDGKGNPLKFKTSKEAEDYLANNSKFDYKAIKTLNLGAPKSIGITIPAGEKSFTIGEEGSNTGYGERVESNTFNMKVNRLETAEVYTGNDVLTVGLFRMEKGDIIPKEVSKYVSDDKREKRVFVVGEVETSYKTNVGPRDKGGTVYVPATKQNISSIISTYSPKDPTRRMLEEINIGKQKLGDGKIIGAATKGAETQPQSGFSLLQFDTFA